MTNLPPPGETERILAEMKARSEEIAARADVDYGLIAQADGPAAIRFFGTERLQRAHGVAMDASDLATVQKISLELTRRHIARGGR